MLINRPKFTGEMEINILEENGKSMVFEVKGENHTLCNVLKRELWSNKHVKTATYAIKHPLIGIPEISVETDGEIKPRKAVMDAADKLIDEVEKFGKEFKKLK